MKFLLTKSKQMCSIKKNIFFIKISVSYLHYLHQGNI